MTRTYFVRHAQPLHLWKEDRTRPLTEEGMKERYNFGCHILWNSILTEENLKRK